MKTIADEMLRIRRSTNGGFWLAALVCLSLSAPFTASAQKLYKVVGADGKVSYQDMPPASETDQFEEKHVDLEHSKLRRDPLPKKDKPNGRSGSRLPPVDTAAVGEPSAAVGEPSAAEINEPEIDELNPRRQPIQKPARNHLRAGSQSRRQAAAKRKPAGTRSRATSREIEEEEE